MEINARSVSYMFMVASVISLFISDSRSGQVIDDRIRPTLESGSAVGSKKPVCVVIDEIDGATGAGENVCLIVDFELLRSLSLPSLLHLFISLLA